MDLDFCEQYNKKKLKVDLTISYLQILLLVVVIYTIIILHIKFFDLSLIFTQIGDSIHELLKNIIFFIDTYKQSGSN